MARSRASLKLVAHEPEPERCTDHDAVILPDAVKRAFHLALGEIMAVRPAVEGMSTTEVKRREAKARMTRAGWALIEAAEKLG